MEMTLAALILIFASVFSSCTFGLDPPQCGSQKEGELCPNNLCCSAWGFCGSTDIYCNEGCQSQCSGGGEAPPPPPPAGGGIESLLSSSEFDKMLSHRDDPYCPAHGFYTYQGFVSAAKTFPEFAATGNITARKREIAAFLAQTSYETDGVGQLYIYTFGYCYASCTTWWDTYCKESVQWPCVDGKYYCGRGPMRLKYNDNYGKAGEALGYDLLNNPELVETNETISFETALWFWMTPQSPIPSCHHVMSGEWLPSEDDVAARRLPGYGATTNIIDGLGECGRGPVQTGQRRIGFYKRYCNILGVTPGDHLDCYDQTFFHYSQDGLLGNTYMQ